MEVSENVMCRSLQAHRRSQAPPFHRTQPVSDCARRAGARVQIYPAGRYLLHSLQPSHVRTCARPHAGKAAAVELNQVLLATKTPKQKQPKEPLWHHRLEARSMCGS